MDGGVSPFGAIPYATSFAFDYEYNIIRYLPTTSPNLVSTPAWPFHGVFFPQSDLANFKLGLDSLQCPDCANV